MSDGDDLSFYLLGLATGLGLGIALAAPSSHDLLVKLDRDDYAALADPSPNPALEQRICQHIKDALAEHAKSRDSLAFICPDQR